MKLVVLIFFKNVKAQSALIDGDDSLMVPKSGGIPHKSNKILIQRQQILGENTLFNEFANS
jgi:hypothetical protein